MLDINIVQRMTDSGRRVNVRATVIVGNRNGYVGLGQAKDVQVGPAIRKAIDAAKPRYLLYPQRLWVMEIAPAVCLIQYLMKLPERQAV